MFTKILIANRGEIACRVARTARRMGIRTVAVYSDADADALHVRSCDEAYRIGPAAPRESYLNIAAVLAVAARSGAQAIHPGYGFLSENEAFAEACAEARVVFIGPPPRAIAAMGSKSAAKIIMADAQVPLVPGYHGDGQDPAMLAREAEKIGFPVLIKATAGGGGKGMKIVNRGSEFAAALASAQREAKASFGDDRVLIERYLTSPRHIEIQVFADTHGDAVYLFERDCSVQRRHQKVLEEAPAPGMDPARRRAMGEAAVAAAKAIGYQGAGTVEFIAEQDGTFYFMEMNTRLQVEHPVTEMITGLDLVEWQLRVAAGEPLPLRQDQLAINGHALEARLYAEDPERGFLPSIGLISHWRMPAESARVRVDTGVREGDEVSSFYDPMLAKLIVWGEDRAAACAEMIGALRQCEVVGVATNISFLERVVAHDAFASARLDTGLIESNRDALFPPPGETPEVALIAAAVAEFSGIVEDAECGASRSGDPYSPWHVPDAWWLNRQAASLPFTFGDGELRHGVRVQPLDEHDARIVLPTRIVDVHFGERDGRLVLEFDDDALAATVIADGDERHVFAGGVRRRLTFVDPLAHAGEVETHGGHLTAPMSGAIVAVMVKAGDKVARGAPLIVLEAMKMEHTIVAPADGIVASVNFAVGERVAEGADLVDLVDAESD
ncbi:MAG TPA: acetyl/propionyl/methylcrotonyl-CoA carboxylase subunit alpha [Casimicrobiaceae bacterium]|nr:acetyl/propionyl/methylcrotonyl-CoA carboxylase subunit alpha [Casimicrobiaceae bacterium]